MTGHYVSRAEARDLLRTVLTDKQQDAVDANAMAAMLAHYLDGHPISLADLPLSARRRIVAYQHQHGAGRLGARGYDQHGPLPDVPPSTPPSTKPGRTIDVTALEDTDA